MMKPWLAFSAMTLCTACGAAPGAVMQVMEEDEESEERLRRTSPGLGDVNWLMYVANYDVSEVKLARLARMRSNEPLVQEFGVIKVQRHQRSFDQAVALAAQGNYPLPAGVTAIGEQHYQRLNHIGHALFDREFLALQVQLHREAAHAAAEAAAQAPAGEVREWASRAWNRWHRDEVWAARLYQQVLTGHRRAGLQAAGAN